MMEHRISNLSVEAYFARADLPLAALRDLPSAVKAAVPLTYCGSLLETGGSCELKGAKSGRKGSVWRLLVYV